MVVLAFIVSVLVCNIHCRVDTKISWVIIIPFFIKICRIARGIPMKNLTQYYCCLRATKGHDI